MSGTELKQRGAAILAAAVAGYLRLMAADERATVAALDAARAVCRTSVAGAEALATEISMTLPPTATSS